MITPTNSEDIASSASRTAPSNRVGSNDIGAR
jgi:hypothetical protein